MATMLDVAKKAGVSKATVSRVLTGNNYVSKTTRDRVFQAIEEIGYRPNLLARQLATSKSQIIGLVVTNTLYSGPYFSELLFQTATMTEKYGRQLIMADGKHSAEEEREAIQFLLDLRCDAVIIYPRFLSIEALESIIEQHEQPIMVVNRTLHQHSDNGICADHQQHCHDAVNYLITQGHRDIAFICGSSNSPTGTSRLAGYRQALVDNGIPCDDRLIAQGDWTHDSGYTAAKSLLQRTLTFSALVASNDDMAIGAAKALREHGLAIPQDVSLLGFDDLPMASWFYPPLTTVHVPVAEMINYTLEKLLCRLEGETVIPAPAFKGTLIIRDSVSKGPQSGILSRDTV
ncbi:LacI-family transcriptional regulator [Pectobacterium atrosepticum SCRI1043]|uniref:LacI-family transcriptional regulator n=1 Tax=Pectobacterium atrosepticum (strain SCRI 1043 / ATCC BAA-672) TaxID=218491 RepID=Q6CYR9_PECAS|nr:LacI family DNA-binding transcriptional regulator [Pectobacterium atrosepticum]AIA73194.1 transcriptional regulator [Pectobacterium atrosepticum]AIK16221.1 LacI-family transcriptional regulator [Pectobacterium atrosepticum]MCL6318092.1 LacI family DNA-binding transcriptional regulator [Pectobacterium atrosepticum]MCL6322759.1 LacI family DNA-binding transcriptional regulator [Pectobacterium atrosepticum]POW23698.1 LacI family transcriptional regulator [Pectobacterium atrosepticum]